MTVSCAGRWSGSRAAETSRNVKARRFGEGEAADLPSREEDPAELAQKRDLEAVVADQRRDEAAEACGRVA